MGCLVCAVATGMVVGVAAGMRHLVIMAAGGSARGSGELEWKWDERSPKCAHAARPPRVAELPRHQLTFFVVVVSATRPNGADYALPLLTKLANQPLKAGTWTINLLDVDPPDRKRPSTWFERLPPATHVLTSSPEPLNVTLDPKQDKLKDSPERIAWRAKEARDMRDALIHGAESGAKFVVVLEDDIDVVPNLFPRLVSLASVVGPPWLGWSLIRTKLDGTTYHHGEAFAFEACTQAMLYRVGPALTGLIASFNASWKELPADWIIRDHQRRTGALFRAAVPSLVDHVGVVSTLDIKNKRVRASKTRVSFCGAVDFSLRL